MTLRNVTIDNSVRYIPQSEQTQERDGKPNTIKISSLPKEHYKKFSRDNKTFNKDYITGEEFRILK